MIKLQFGCVCSNLGVTPRNWKSRSASIKKNWSITYRFYDPRYIKPKQVRVQGMNHFKTLSERQEACQHILDQEYYKLTVLNYNPFNKESENSNTEVLKEETSLITALKIISERLLLAESTKRDIKYLILAIQKKLQDSGQFDLRVRNISRKFIKALLEKVSNTPDRFNKNRSYLMILFSELCELELLEVNPLRDIRKKKVVKKIREVLSDKQRVEIGIYLSEKYPEFYRFLQIFFHSGARITELLSIKGKDVDLENQGFKVVVRKGNVYSEVFKTIKDIALPYWLDVITNCEMENYVFSKGLKPGDHKIQPYQITKRWYRLVKGRLGIRADFYSLKHLHTTEVVDIFGEFEAALHNSHRSTAMVESTYDIRRKSRIHSKIKGLRNEF